MPSLTLDSGVVFFYTDSGAVASDEAYTTLVIIHGHTFHSGTFQHLNPLAAPNSLRLISVNRREYPGSSPYNDEELACFAEGDEEQRASLLAQQGRDLALFLDGVIQDLSIPKPGAGGGGGVALIGWSMGTLFLMALIASMETLPADTKARLAAQVHTVILLQCPSLALGVPVPSGWHIPYTDPAVPPEARGSAFAKWVSSYFVHGDLSSGTHSLDVLTYDRTDPCKVPTIERLTPAELLAITDFTPAEKYDNIVGLPPFAGPAFRQTRKALFDAAVRCEWGYPQIWNVCGTAEPWNIIHAAWFLEDEWRATMDPQLEMRFAVINGANHFLVWDDPEKAINELKKCLSTPLQCQQTTVKKASSCVIA
ncbi:Alpha/Beta hydrolase protein [Mycena pura]|uniref:Alpha/Beta hydrolase protein n=1 Tax=Mycena pura TaxID=153505 RepID=A0AAD6VJJ6_9AGAR|nr:Alpha/Beta hydrolase protein [Mycena pura]